MRHYLLFSAIILLASCAQKADESPKTFIFAGQISNSELDHLLILLDEEGPDTIPLTSEGNFHASFELDSSRTVGFRLGREWGNIYVSPGDSIHASVDASDFDGSLEYTGTAPSASQFLLKNMIIDQDIRKNHPNSSIHLLDETAFIGFQDSVLIVRDRVMKDASANVPEKLITERRIANQYKWAYAIANYENSARWYQENDSLKVSENFLRSLDAVPLENAEALNVPEYNYYVEQKIYEIMQDKYGDQLDEMDINEFYANQMNTLSEVFTDQAVKEHFIASSVLEVVQYKGSDDLTELIDVLKMQVKTESKINEVMEAYAEWDHLRRGNEAPVFAYTDIDGNEFSLEDFKGKVVYIDVWATWCGPCLGELPSLQELEEEMADENVQFISVSVDDDQEKWQSMVTEDELGGLQLITRTGWQSKITDDYKISGIPRFILVDQEGKLISATAPRPSSGEEIRELIREALNQSTELAVVE